MLPSLASLTLATGADAEVKRSRNGEAKTRNLPDLPDDILSKIFDIVKRSNDPCNGLRELCKTHRNMCSEEIYRAACSRLRYNTEAIRDAFLRSRNVPSAARTWRYCFFQLCKRPKLTDDTFKTALKRIKSYEDGKWTHKKFGHISFWDVSRVTNMFKAFLAFSDFNENIDLWDVSSVTNMGHMFAGAIAFNQPLDWDVSRVTNMENMFYHAHEFNQPLDWDVSNVTDMYRMFEEALVFNQLLDWNVSSVTDMERMFYAARDFNQPLNWNVSRVTDMGHMFAAAISFNQPLDWDVSRVTNMENMFYNAHEFNQPLNWDVSSVKKKKDMFQGSAQDPLPGWY